MMASRVKLQRMPRMGGVGFTETICELLPRKSMHDDCANGNVSETRGDLPN